MSPFDDARWAERRTFIGASESAVCCGLSREDTYLDDWMLHRLKTDPTFAIEENESMALGNIFEAAILKAFETRYLPDSLAMLRNGSTLRHPTERIFGATPDALVYGRASAEARPPAFDDDGAPVVLVAGATGERMTADPIGVVQAKLVLDPKKADQWGASGSSDIPKAYRIQLEHEMLVVDAAFGVECECAYLAALIPGLGFRWYRVTPHARMRMKLINAVRQWWRLRVERGIAPDPADEFERHLVIESMFPRHAGIIDGTPASYETALELWKARELRAAAQRDIDRLENDMLEHMAGARGIRGSGYEVSRTFVEQFERPACTVRGHWRWNEPKFSFE